MDSATLPSIQQAPTSAGHEHPLDVLSFTLAQSQAGVPCALAMITNTIGGAVRQPGALMAVTGNGARCGYLSGGCIDADIALHAQVAIADNKPTQIRYGQGSPFVDIRLPCGGGIDLAIVPTPNMQAMQDAIHDLTERRRTEFELSSIGAEALESSTTPFTATYRPKLKLRIAGIGADPIALIKLASSSGLDAELWSQDEDCRANAAGLSDRPLVALKTPSALPDADDDDHTAFILMAHDPDWETPLLKQALSGPAFYIGAVGSPNTHRKRRETLAQDGVSEANIARIHGPVGLVPSMRDASMLAISCMAEIIDCFHKEPMR